MSQIQSSVGLITGIPIQDTVDQLMAIAAQPRNRLTSRNQSLQAEQFAVDNLTSLVLALQFETGQLGSANLFASKAITSSNDAVLAATKSVVNDPAVGSYQFRSLRTASAQQLVSDRFDSLEDLADVGTLSFGYGGFVNRGISLDEINTGAGLDRGTIRITDRSGTSADIDLRLAQTVDDVLAAINENTTINVTATAVGDAFRLTDNTGQTLSNLIVQELNGGSTAASLGLDGINVAATSASGSDVFSLHTGTKLALLNDGNGIQIRQGSDDLSITLADESTLTFNLAGAKTLGDVLDVINAADPAKLTAAIAADGNRLELTDLTSGIGTFAVSSVGTGTAAQDLGLTATESGGVITGNRLVSGLRDTLVSSLFGGGGLGTLGQVDITNRDGVVSNVDLSAAETLGEIIDEINTQATDVTASINASRNGIIFRDTTGGSASNLIVADGDANNSATALRIVVDDAVTEVNSGTLGRQQISHAALLSSLNRGEGIDLSDFRITDSDGGVGLVDLNISGSEAKTVGDVIDAINNSSANVTAQINETGDGILLIDNAGGTGVLTVTEIGNGTSAADLKLLGTGVDTTVGGLPAHVIDGSAATQIDLSALANFGTVELSTLNGGQGVELGSLKITDTDGVEAVVSLAALDEETATVQDVLDAINAAGIGVEARVNDTGDGILLVDTLGGSETLTVEEVDDGTTATDLGFDGSAITVSIGGQPTQVIDGAGTFPDSLFATRLAALAEQVSDLDVGVTLSTIFDGTGYRISLAANDTGTKNQLLVDATGSAGLGFEELSKARDALLELGGASLGDGILVTSASNSFQNVVPGVNLTLKGTSTDTVTVNVTTDNTPIVNGVQDFVNAFNSIRTNLNQVTAFDEEALTTGLLFGTTAALRVETDLTQAIGARFFGLGSIESLQQIGVSFNDEGKLEFTKSKLEDLLKSDPATVKKFFTDETSGVVTKLTAVLDQLAGEDNSVLVTRSLTLSAKIDSNTDRIESMDAQLERQRERLLLQFYQLETLIANFQSNLSALQNIQALPSLVSSSSGSLLGN